MNTRKPRVRPEAAAEPADPARTRARVRPLPMPDCVAEVVATIIRGAQARIRAERQNAQRQARKDEWK